VSSAFVFAAEPDNDLFVRRDQRAPDVVAPELELSR
jgi:hypothetical protein